MTLKEIFITFCEKHEIPAIVVEEGPETPERIGMMLHGDAGHWESYALCFEEEDLFVYLVNLGVQVPEESRKQVAVLFNDLNYQLKFGGFYLDCEDGYIMARASQYVHGTKEERLKQVADCIKVCAVITDGYYKQIMRTVFGNKDSEEHENA